MIYKVLPDFRSPKRYRFLTRRDKRRLKRRNTKKRANREAFEPVPLQAQRLDECMNAAGAGAGSTYPVDPAPAKLVFEVCVLRTVYRELLNASQSVDAFFKSFNPDDRVGFSIMDENLCIYVQPISRGVLWKWDRMDIPRSVSDTPSRPNIYKMLDHAVENLVFWSRDPSDAPCLILFIGGEEDPLTCPYTRSRTLSVINSQNNPKLRVYVVMVGDVTPNMRTLAVDITSAADTPLLEARTPEDLPAVLRTIREHLEKLRSLAGTWVYRNLEWLTCTLDKPILRCKCTSDQLHNECKCTCRGEVEYSSCSCPYESETDC
jgi:hypothetical protein